MCVHACILIYLYLVSLDQMTSVTVEQHQFSSWKVNREPNKYMVILNFF